jgi:hypothetical protein
MYFLVEHGHLRPSRSGIPTSPRKAEMPRVSVRPPFVASDLRLLVHSIKDMQKNGRIIGAGCVVSEVFILGVACPIG